MGLREKFNSLSKTNSQKIGLVNAQKAWIMQRLLEKNLDRKLPQKGGSNEPSIIKEGLKDNTVQGIEMINFLNNNNMPIPEFYRMMFGVKEWQAGMPVFYQTLGEEIKDLPNNPTPQQKEFIKKYS